MPSPSPLPFSLCGLFLSLAAGIHAPATEFYHHGSPSDLEQLLLERINQTRADPSRQGAHLGVSIRDGPPRQPLVFNAALLRASEDHSRYLIAEGTFSHQGAGGSSARQRMAAAGYPFGSGHQRWAENLGLYEVLGVTPEEALHLTQDLIFKSDQHRTSLLEDSFREIGLGVELGSTTVQGTLRDVIVVTQNFAVSSSSPTDDAHGSFLQGVVYDDGNENHRYDLGEGIPEVTVTPSHGRYHTSTSSAGGYALPMSNLHGSLTLTFSHETLQHTHAITMISGRNGKVDLRLQDLPLPTPPTVGNAEPNLPLAPLKISSINAAQLSFSIPDEAFVPGLTMQHSTDLQHWVNLPVILRQTFQLDRLERRGFYRLAHPSP